MLARSALFALVLPVLGSCVARTTPGEGDSAGSSSGPSSTASMATSTSTPTTLLADQHDLGLRGLYVQAGYPDRRAVGAAGARPVASDAGPLGSRRRPPARTILVDPAPGPDQAVTGVRIDGEDFPEVLTCDEHGWQRHDAAVELCGAACTRFRDRANLEIFVTCV